MSVCIHSYFSNVLPTQGGPRSAQCLHYCRVGSGGSFALNVRCCYHWQLACVLLPGNDALLHVVDRFQLLSWALSVSPSLGSSKTAALPLPGMMEDLMRVLLNVVQQPPLPLQCYKSDTTKDNEVRRQWKTARRSMLLQGSTVSKVTASKIFSLLVSPLHEC